MSSAPVYCTNHPQTETLLRCIKCDRPFCIKCLVRTPVGYRCKECLNIQQAGYYTATASDYVITAIVGVIASIVSGAMAAAISGFWLFAIFYAPVAGGIIAEITRAAIQKRRGRYVWLVACAMVMLGTFVGAGARPAFAMLAAKPNVTGIVGAIVAVPVVGVAQLLNIGFLIYLVLAVSTVYARLR